MPRGEKGHQAKVDVGPMNYVQGVLHIATALEWESGQKCTAPDSLHP